MITHRNGIMWNPSTVQPFFWQCHPTLLLLPAFLSNNSENSFWSCSDLFSIKPLPSSYFALCFPNLSITFGNIVELYLTKFPSQTLQERQELQRQLPGCRCSGHCPGLWQAPLGHQPHTDRGDQGVAAVLNHSDGRFKCCRWMLYADLITSCYLRVW